MHNYVRTHTIGRPNAPGTQTSWFPVACSYASELLVYLLHRYHKRTCKRTGDTKNIVPVLRRGTDTMRTVGHTTTGATVQHRGSRALRAHGTHARCGPSCAARRELLVDMFGVASARRIENREDLHGKGTLIARVNVNMVMRGCHAASAACARLCRAALDAASGAWQQPRWGLGQGTRL